MPFVHVETVLVEYLTEQFPDVRVCTETPSTMTGDPIVVRVEKIGGNDGIVSFDHSRVDIDVFGPDRDTARKFAEQVRTSLIFDAPGKTAAGVVIADAKTSSSPSRAHWDNSSLRRFVATYEVTTHANPN